MSYTMRGPISQTCELLRRFIELAAIGDAMKDPVHALKQGLNPFSGDDIEFEWPGAFLFEENPY